MSKNKFKLSKRSSKKMFSKNAVKTPMINQIKGVPMRGGFRL